MKNLLIIITLLTSYGGYAQSGAQATFASKGLKLADVKEGAQVKVVWYFTNTGDAPLKILSASPSCGCTLADYPKYDIAPGAKDSIVATFNTTDRPHYNAKGVNLTSNVGDISLVFEINVLPAEGDIPEDVDVEEENHEGHNH
ncbi:MAG: DUF1573 domain-containing protein [Bacteroidetes bacterium]|jgi:hypothetical protein|nr:DUF1573 domain-containing protein [Bacteroidota bacterium]MDA8930223.1 DUF1573 domain-containing protein [Bacteroidia bacterium]